MYPFTPTDEEVNSFYDAYANTFMSMYINLSKDKDKTFIPNPQEETENDSDLFISLARADIERKIRTDKRKATLTQIKQLNSFKRIKNEATIRKLYDEYLDGWYKKHPDDKPKEEQQTVKYVFNDTGLIGYKGKDKLKVLTPMFPNKHAIDNKVKSTFDLKYNVKHYQLHKCAARNTWIIDLMFCDKLAYLVAINVNTKFLRVEVLNDKISEDEFVKGNIKSSRTYLNVLQHMMNSGMTVQHLTGDGEKAFNSFEANIFYTKKGIDFKPVPRQVMGAYPDFMKKEQKAVKTDPLHGSLGIIDRVIRTIRDMAYNMQIGVITPLDMDDIVKQYNHAPHKGLSKWAGFVVSPQMVNDDPELEEFIVRKICQENYNVMSTPGFTLNEGAHVKVYNEKDAMNKRRSIIQPGDFVINGFRNGLYEVSGKVNGKNMIQMIPRYKLDLA